MKHPIQPPREPRLQVNRPVFVIVGMMRSGSNYLERSLNSLPGVRCHGELFNPKFIGLAADLGGEYLGFKRQHPAGRHADPVGMLQALIDACDRPALGFRLFLDHDGQATSEALYHPAVRKVLLTRNYLESFVSLQIARETDVWLSTRKARPGEQHRVHVDPDELIQFTLRQSCYYNDVLSLLNQTGQDAIQIDYDELKDVAALNRVLAFIGVPDRFEAVHDPIERQNPGYLRDKIINYQPLVDALRKRGMARWFV